MKLQSIQAIIFDARFTALQAGNFSREGTLLGYLQPFLRESLERLGMLGYAFFWLDADRAAAENFLNSQHILHFFKKIHALPLEIHPQPSSFEGVLRESGYLPEHVLYLSFQLNHCYILAKKIGCACFLFQESAATGTPRVCLPKLYTLVPWLIKSKGLAPLYWNGPRRSVLQLCLGIPGWSPFVPPKNTKPLSELVDQVFQQLQPGDPRLEEAILRSWETIVGSRLASQCRPGRLVRGRQLVILAYNAIIKQELHFQARPILKKLQGLPGGEQLVEISIQQRG